MTQKKICLQMLAHNVNPFLKAALLNSIQYVDKIYIGWSGYSWNYGPNTRKNRTTLSFIEETLAQVDHNSDKTKIEIGSWQTETDERNALLDLAKQDGFDWMSIQDADELYTKASWEMISIRLRESIPGNMCFTTSALAFIKDPSWTAVDLHGNYSHECFILALPCAAGVSFKQNRHPNTHLQEHIDVTCFHFSYILDNAELWDKISTWAHRNDFDRHRWFKYKWVNWHPLMINVHPIWPSLWPRIGRYKGEFPEHAFGILVLKMGKRTYSWYFLLYDTVFEFLQAVKRFGVHHALRNLLIRFKLLFTF